MTTSIIAGHNLGLDDTSLRILNRRDTAAAGSLNQNVDQQTYVNVANGNLVIQERDTLLTSRGEDFSLVRTYNSRGRLNSSINGMSDWGWTWSTGILLSKNTDTFGATKVDGYEVVYGDGTAFYFDYDASRKLWVSTDGAGAFETLAKQADGSFLVTRANQSVVKFNAGMRLTSITDTNGVQTSFEYANASANKLTRIIDDTGYVITLNYKSSMVGTVMMDLLDNMSGAGGVSLVKYGWTNGLLTSVTDRQGHVTTYTYNSNKMLTGITLPEQQTANGQLLTPSTRTVQFTYQTVSWKDTPHFKSAMDNGPMYILSEVVDPSGARTSFEYGFTFANARHGSDRDLRYTYTGSSFLTGGLTRVVNALGNARATANDAETSAWRVANGYYATYDAAKVKASAALTAQYNAIRTAQSVSYAYDADGYLTSVTDEAGFRTAYAYDSKDNLTSVIDRNGHGVTTSDSAYFRSLRKDLGYVDVSGNGKLAASLTAAEKTALLARYTTSYTYDASGNLLSATDHAGNLTSYTWTSFNKIASVTAAMGNALAGSDALAIQQKRAELGYPALLASLSAAQKAALKALYTTSYQYDARQNLISQTDPGGDLTRYEYDAYGNLARRIVYTDKNDLTTPARQQITVYGYDAYGNNTSITDAEGNTSTFQYDAFGNLLRMVDARGGVSTRTYDAANRLLTSQDAEGNVTAYAWDAVGNMIAVTDANGHTVTRVYDAANRLLSVLDPSATLAAQNRSTTMRYDVLGNQVQSTDAEGRVTTYRYDARRLLVQIGTPQVLRVNADGSESLTSYNATLAYDGETNVVTATDNNGNTTQTLYNNLNLVRRVTDASGNVTETSYDANLNAVQVVIGAQLATAQQRVLRWAYDQKDRKVRAVDALGGVMQTAYDGADNAIAVTDANGNTTNYEYDRNNRLLKEIRPQVTDPRSGLPVRDTVLHQYDANGNEIATTDENGNITTTSFDRDNRRVLVTDANGIKTAFAWDSRSNLTQVAIGVSASLDANGRVVISGADDAQVTSYVYDEFRQLVAVTDGVGNALASSNAQTYQDMRVALGLPALASDLTAAQRNQVQQAYTTRYGYDRAGNRVQETDHLGRITKIGFDALDRIVSVTEAFGLAEQRVSQMRYDGNDNLVRSVDANGGVARMSYDGMNRLTGMTDAVGNVSSYQYDNVGNRTGMSEGVGTPAVRSSSWVYDLNNRVVTQTSGAGRTMRYEYDAVGNRLKMTDGRGNATRYVYDARDRQIKVIDPTSFETRYEYDGVGNQITMVDARGGVTRFAYDPGNRRIQVTDAEGRVTRFDYDVLARVVTQTTDPGGSDQQVSRFTYDAQGHLRNAVDARGARSASDYDAQYNLLSSVDGNGNSTRYGYDALDRQILITDALGKTTRFTYDALQNHLTQTDTLGRVRSFTYDANNRAITETDALGMQTRYAYDAVGNQASITHAANRPGEARTRSFSYDADGLLLQETDALGKSSTYVYDGARNVASVTDARGNITRYQYDANNRVSQVIDAQGNAVSYQYDDNGNRVKTMDGNGNVGLTWYNRNNEADLTMDARGYATLRQFDRNGNVVQETRVMTAYAGVPSPAVRPVLPLNAAIDQVTRYEYDALNRLARRIDALGNTTSYDYDDAGNLVVDRDENGNATTQVYDSNNRPVSKTDAQGATERWTWDNAGNISTHTDENGNVTSYGYDSQNRLITRTDSLGNVTAYSYDSVGNLLSQADELGNTTRYSYDSKNRVSRETDPNGGTWTYTWDAEDNRIRMVDPNGNATSTWYDRNHRAILSIDAMGFATSWTYDGNGNVLVQTRWATPITGSIDPTLPPPTPVPAAAPVGLAPASAASVDQVIRYTYDKNNRPTQMVDASGGIWTWAYDGAGNQVRAVDPNGNVTTSYYDGSNRKVLSIDGEGHATGMSYDAAGNLASETRYMNRVAMPVDPAARPVLASSGADQVTRYTWDSRRRMTSKTDAGGAIERYTYDAAGNRNSVTDANGNVTRTWYDKNQRAVLQVDALGYATAWEYDGAGNLIRETSYMTPLASDGLSTSSPLPAPAPAGSAADQVITYAYDRNNRMVRKTDANGGIWSWAYDAAGNVVQVTDANGNSTRSWYNASNRLVLRVGALGDATGWRYDAVGNVLSMTRYMNLVSASGSSQPVPVASAADQVTSYAWDGSNRLLAKTDALGNTERYGWDAAGNQVSITDARGNTTRTWYDRDNRVVLRVDALGYATAYAHDAVGNVVAETRYMTALTVNATVPDAPTPVAGSGDQVTRFAFDANNRLVMRTDALGGVTAYAYDAVGNRTSVTDANGNVTRSWYDRGNRLLLLVDAGGAATGFTYDAADNLLAQTRYMSLVTGPFSGTPPVPAAGSADQTTSYTFDANNRQVTRTDALGGISRTQYDAVGNRIAETDANGNTSRTWYDSENRVLMQVDAIGNATAWTRDAVGNALTRRLYMTPLSGVGAALPTPTADSADQITSYSYDGNNRLRTLTDGEGGVTRYAYDAAGNRVRVTDANGNSSLAWYDANNRAILQADASGAATGLSYDAIGNLLTQTRYMTLLAGALDPATLPMPAISAGDQVTSWTWDANNRMLTRTDAAGAVSRMRYDAVGNRIADTDANGNTRRSWYDSLNRQVLQVDATGAATAYAYDAVGNLSSRTRHMTPVSVSGNTAPAPEANAKDQLTRYNWDANNRLVGQTDAEGNAASWTYDAAGNQLRAIDALGHAVTSWYDRNNRRVLQMDAEGYATQWTYDAAGNLTQRKLFMTAHALGADTTSVPALAASAADQVTAWQYDRANRLLAQTDASGNTSTFTVDAAGNRITSTDALGNTTRFAWDKVNRMVSRTAAMGDWLATSNSVDAKAWRGARGYYALYTGAASQAADRAAILASQTERYEWDAAGNRVKLTDANGNATTYAWDANNRLLRTTDALGNTSSNSWDAVGNLVAATDGNGNLTRYAYDRENRLVSTVSAMGNWLATSNAAAAQAWRVAQGYYQNFVPGGVPAADVAAILASQSQVATYDAAGNRVSLTDANGHTTSFAYDRNNRLVTRTDALNHSTSYTYDGAGNQLSMTDARGNATSYTYDRNNRLLATTDALGHTRANRYDGAGNLVAATDARGGVTTYAWDASNRLLARTDALGNERATSNSDSAKAWRSARGYYAIWTGAASQMANRQAILAAHTERYAYDAAGNRISMTDANGNTTSFGYDANLRLTSQANALGDTTRYGYDAAGNRTSVTDGRGNKTASSYDAANRLVDVQDALGNHTRYAWDAAGNRISTTDGRNNVTRYAYDANNRLLSMQDAVGYVTSYAYDAVGNQLAMTDARGNTTRYVYDAANWLTSRTDALGYATSYTYDAVGNVLTQTQRLDLTDSNRVAIIRNTWDAANRLRATRSAEGYLTVYDHDAAGNRTAVSLFDLRVAANADPATIAASNAVRRTTRFAYDADNRVSSETSALSVVTGYEYDAVGNRTAKIEAQGSSHARRSEVAYDAANRAVRTTDAAGIVTRMVRDAAGNLTELHENWSDTTNSAGRVTLTSYDALNRASTITDALSHITRLSYDAAGNLVKRESAYGLSEARTESFEYDAANREVAQVNGANDRTTYVLDGLGNRVAMTVGAGTAAARTLRYRYDADGRLIAEIDGNGVETRYQLDGAGNRLQTIQVAATYDAAGNQLDTWNGNSISSLQRATAFGYDLDNRLVRVVDPMGGDTRYTLDVLGNRTKIIDARGKETSNTFDAAGRLLTNLVAGSNADNGVLVANVYDDFGNIIQSRRGFANNTDVRQTSYTWDALNRQLSITSYDRVATLTASTVFSQGFSTVFSYDAWGKQTSISRGQYLLQSGDTGYDSARAALVHALTGSFAYDALGRMVSSTDGAGNVIAYTYDALGNRLTQTTGSGTTDARTISFAYDGAGRLVKRSTGTGAVIKMTYDAAGNQVGESTLQSGSETGTAATGNAPVWMNETFGVDGNGRIIRQVDALGTVTLRTLDPFGNEVRTTLASGTSDERVLRQQYDANNELVAEFDALGNASTYTVDANGNRTSETDAAGYITYFWYDSLNRQVASLDPGGNLITLAYDSAGNVLTTKAWQKTYSVPADGSAPAPLDSDTARVTTNTYSGSGKLLTQVAPDGRSLAFAYDSADELTSITDNGNASGATARVQSFGYDNAGRKTSFTRADGVVETYAYDSAGNRVRETITTYDKDGNVVLARRTDISFDADNRQTSRAFDPNGLNLTETLSYDKAGNVIGKTDANGNVTKSRYDLSNRLLSITDAATAALAQLRATSNDQVWKDWRDDNGYYVTYNKATVDADATLTAQYQAILALRTQSYAYDRVGNRTSITDALDRTTTLQYDLANRVTRTLQPAATMFTIAGGLQSNVRPTVDSVYDAVGNLVQTTDARGYKTTWWYDGNRNRIAELKAQITGANVLRTFSYNADGLLASASLYMTELADSAHDIDTLPTAPATGEVRTITNSYDTAGRLTKITYPSITITSLTGTDSASPTASTRTAQPEEKFSYDAFGNRVKSEDRNGNASWKWYDSNDRVTASVDEAGFLTTYSYDDQGNAVQEVRYATALSLSGLAVGTRPTAPGGASFTVTRTYDKANRLVTEQLPTVSALHAGTTTNERPTTKFEYDKNGNLLRKRLAPDTGSEASEYYLYDAANRQVAIVDAARVLHVIGYDAAGNRVSFKRYLSPVNTGSLTGGLTTATTLAQLLAATTASASGDEETVYTYDALDRQITSTEVMGSGSGDDIVIQTWYDAAGKQTKRIDPDGYATQTAYDAFGQVTQTVSPDGNRSFIEYDAAGMQTRAWTGDLGSNAASAATGITASIGTALNVNWSVTGKGVTTYVVWDTTAHNAVADYARTSARQGSGSASVALSLAGISAGSTVYFRVVTVDAAGSQAWTAEKSVVVPVMMSALSVAQSSGNLVVSAVFNGTVTGPQLKYGATGGALGSTVNFSNSGGNTWSATISSPSNGGQGLSWQVAWTANGNNYTTAATTFDANGTHEVSGTVNKWTASWPVPTLAQGNAQLVLLDGARVDSAFTVNEALQFDPGSFASGASKTYQVFYGDSVSTSHSTSVSWMQAQMQTFSVAGYNTHKDANNVTVVDSTVYNATWVNVDGNVTAQTSLTLGLSEWNRVNFGGMHVSWRVAGSGSSFTSDVVMSYVGGTSFNTNLTLAANTSYDLKFWYTDISGPEVIVEWRTLTSPAQPASSSAGQVTTAGENNTPSANSRTISIGSASSWNGNSLKVRGRELDGKLTRSGSTLSVDPGLYIGPVSPGSAAFSATVNTTASTGAGSLQASGLTTASYFTEFRYNAIGNKIATNETSGQWRRLGVDAMGNILKTSVYGTRADETGGATPIVTYAAFDARGLEVARFGAAVAVDTNGDGADDSTTRAVTRFGYDYERRKTSQVDPGNTSSNAQSFVYNALGQVTSQTDARGNTTTIEYDRRGNEVRRTDALGHATGQGWNSAGRRTSQTDALGNSTSYTLDAFGRINTITDARGNATSMQYDQHDRLIKVTDALANVTEYSYDKRDNRTWTKDANGNFFGVAYDNMRRVTARHAFSGGAPTSFADAAAAVTDTSNAAHAFLLTESAEYDVYGNKISETDAEGRQKLYTYGAFARLATVTDEGQRVTSYTYDRFGRLTSEARPDDDTTSGAKDITRTYDDAGHVKTVTDNTTKVSTSTTYTVAGQRAHETVSAPGLTGNTGTVAVVRNISYTWDAMGQMTGWTDSSTSTNLSYTWDASGKLARAWNSDTSVNHYYSYDAADRLTSKTQGSGGTTLEAYTYDAVGNRLSFNDGANTATYTVNAVNRVTQAVTSKNTTLADSSDDTKAQWTYDKVGNITKYEEFDKNAASIYLQTYTLTQNYRTSGSSTNNQRDSSATSNTTTLNTLDKSGRLTKEVTTDNSASKTYTYAHTYSKDGRELKVTATGTGSLTGSSTSTYDSNDKLIRLDLGKPDGSNNTSAYKQFRYGNDGQILTSFYDNGVSGDQDVNAEYLYANGHIVGQKANTTSSATVTTVLDDKDYSLNDIIGATYPGAAVSLYEVQAGDSLQSIAAKQFGNSSLWYVIADANALTGAESLKPGTRLVMPNSVAMGRLDADAHVVYKESQIIGSKLPNLAAPPPPEPDKCAQAAAIILTILVSIIAVVATVLTAGALAPLAIAAAGVTATSVAGIIIGATVGAVVGAAIGLASGAINQGIKIGLKVQDEFNWKEVAADVAAGAIGGVGAAFSGVAQASIKAAVAAEKLGTNAARLARVATVAMDAAFNVAGEAASQAITYNGRIEEPWMFGVAAGASILGEALKPLGSRAWRAIKPTALGQSLQSAGSTIKSGFGKAFRFARAAGTAVSTSADRLTEAGDNALASSLRSADARLAISADGKADLDLRTASTAFDANKRTSAFSPGNLNDNAAHTLAPVQGQSTFDNLADAKTVDVTKKALAGEVSGLTSRSQVDLAQNTVGRVRNNTIPALQISSNTPELGRLRSASAVSDQWEAGLSARQTNISVATPRNAEVNTPSMPQSATNYGRNPSVEPDGFLNQLQPTPGSNAIANTDLNVDTPRLNSSLGSDAPSSNAIAPTYGNLSLDDLDTPNLGNYQLADALDGLPGAPPSTPRGGIGDAPTGRSRYGSLPGRVNDMPAFNGGLDEVETSGLRARSNSAPELETPATSNRIDAPDNRATADELVLPQQNNAPTPVDNAPAPLRTRNRAFAREEARLPEPTLDARSKVAASSKRIVLSPDVIGDERAAAQSLREYFVKEFDIKLIKQGKFRQEAIDAMGPKARRYQNADNDTLREYFLKQLDARLTKKSAMRDLVTAESDRLAALKPNTVAPKSVRDEDLYGFQVLVANTEISASKKARKEMAEYLRLRELDIATGPVARTKQFAEMDQALSRALGDSKLSKPSQQVIRYEMQLLQDTANDPHLLSSAFIRNPTHAMELKRLGLQSSAATRVGQFTDVRLDGVMKELGSGNQNTVFLGKYTLPDNQGSFEGVFKMEARELRSGVDVLPIAGDFAGINMRNPRFGYRNVASTRLDEMLGFGVITRTEMGIYRGKLGTVAERAKGVSPKGSEVRRLPRMLTDEEVEIKRNVARKIEGYADGTDWTNLINRDSDDIIERVVNNGKEEFYSAKRTAHEINYSDPVVRRGLVRLQLEDAISGQVDRHYGNYFVLQDAGGNVISIKGIDNDLSWGRTLRQVEKIGNIAVHLPDYLPRVVDKQAFESIMALNREQLTKRLGGVLQRDEIDAAVTRLDLVKAHLKKLETKGRILNSLEDWRGDQVGDLLARRKGVGPDDTDFQTHHTSYVSRDMALLEHKHMEGLVDPYPANRYA